MPPTKGRETGRSPKLACLLDTLTLEVLRCPTTQEPSISSHRNLNEWEKRGFLPPAFYTWPEFSVLTVKNHPLPCARLLSTTVCSFELLTAQPTVWFYQPDRREKPASPAAPSHSETAA